MFIDEFNYLLNILVYYQLIFENFLNFILILDKIIIILKTKCKITFRSIYK